MMLSQEERFHEFRLIGEVKFEGRGRWDRLTATLHLWVDHLIEVKVSCSDSDSDEMLPIVPRYTLTADMVDLYEYAQYQQTINELEKTEEYQQLLRRHLENDTENETNQQG